MEKKEVVENKGGINVEGSRLRDTHHKNKLQSAEDLSGYCVERNRCIPGCKYSRGGGVCGNLKEAQS